MSLKCPRWQFVNYLSMKDEMLLEGQWSLLTSARHGKRLTPPMLARGRRGPYCQLVELLTSQRTATATVEAEKVPEGCPLPLTPALY